MDANEVMARILFTDPSEEEREFLEKEMIKILQDELDAQIIRDINNYFGGNT